MFDFWRPRTIALSGLAGIVFLVLIIATIGSSIPPQVKTVLPATNKPASSPPFSGSVLKNPSANQNLPDETKQNSSLGISSAVQDFLDKVASAYKTADKKMVARGVSTSTPSAQKKFTVTNKEVALNITNDEFHYIYTNQFLDLLTDKAQKLIQRYDSQYVPLAELRNDAEVRMVQERLTDILVAQGWFTEERRAQYLHGMRFVLPELQLADIEARNQVNAENALPSSERLLRTASRFLGALPDALALLLHETGKTASETLQESIATEVSAQTPTTVTVKTVAFCDNDGQCCYYELPECFANGAAFDGKAGAVTVTPYCDCDSYYYYLGCISFCRNSYGAASIWDGPYGSVGQAPTNICGCGLGGGGGGDAGGAGGAF